MHSFISSQSYLLLTKCHALWLSPMQDESNIQMQPNLFKDEILSFEMMVMLNIVGLNFWTSAVFLWHVFVFLLAKLETLFGFVSWPFHDGGNHLIFTVMRSMVTQVMMSGGKVVDFVVAFGSLNFLKNSNTLVNISNNFYLLKNCFENVRLWGGGIHRRW